MDLDNESQTTSTSEHVLITLSSFCWDVRNAVDGHNGATNGHFQKKRRAYAAFRRAIRSTTPPFVPFPSVSEAPDEVLDYVEKELKVETNVSCEGLEELPRDTTIPTIPICLEDVKRHIQLSITRELPHNIPYAAKVSLIRSFQSSWEAHVNDCLSRVYHSFRDMILCLVITHFGDHKALTAQVERAVLKSLEQQSHLASIATSTLLKFEVAPFTQATQYLAETTNCFFTRYRDVRTTSHHNFATVQTDSEHPTTTEVRSDTFSRPIDEFEAKQRNPFKPFVPPPISILLHPLPPSTPIFCHVEPLGNYPPPEDVPLVKTRKGKKKKKSTSPLPPPRSLPPFVTATRDIEFDSVTTDPEESLFWRRVSLSRSLPQLCSNFRPHNTHNDNASPACLSSNLPDIDLSVSHSSINDHEQPEAEALALLTKLGYVGLTPEDLRKLAPVVDEYEEELRMMADVRAYFQVAYERIIDYVPMTIDHYLLDIFAENLQTVLIEALGCPSPDAPSRSMSYLAEDLAAMNIAAREDSASLGNSDSADSPSAYLCLI